MKLRPKFDREFLSVNNGQNYITYGKNFLWNSKKNFPVNYMEMAVTYGEKSFMEQTPGVNALSSGTQTMARTIIRHFSVNLLYAHFDWLISQLFY